MNLLPGKRIAGVLVPLFALRGENDLGIGDLGALREFIDWIAEIGFTLVQLLPINETGADNSPYNAISAIAIDPTTLHLAPGSPEDLTRNDFEDSLSEIDLSGLRRGRVKYRQVKELKQRICEKAFANFSARADEQNSNGSAKTNGGGCAITRCSAFSSSKITAAPHGTNGRNSIRRSKVLVIGCAIFRCRSNQS
jgi:4-alpha-glucanotransferase